MHGFDHQCILARVPECPVWHLVDVGFGANCPVQPLALEAPDTDAFTGEDLKRFHQSANFGPGLLCSVPSLGGVGNHTLHPKGALGHMKAASAVRCASAPTISASCSLQSIARVVASRL